MVTPMRTAVGKSCKFNREIRAMELIQLAAGLFLKSYKNAVISLRL